MNTNLQQRLRALRQEFGLSQEALSNALDVGRSTIIRWENGKTAVPPYLEMTLDGLEKRLRQQRG